MDLEAGKREEENPLVETPSTKEECPLPVGQHIELNGKSEHTTSLLKGRWRYSNFLSLSKNLSLSKEWVGVGVDVLPCQCCGYGCGHYRFGTLQRQISF